MGKFQIFVLLSVVTCAIISTVQSVPVSDSSVQSENAAKCKKLCGFCGCDGYYCGDECLCECNSSTEGKAECVDAMKSNCEKLELPFEVLIQGPNVNRMVRSLLYADPEVETCDSSESNQKKRSTISIYKPHVLQQHVEIVPAPPAVEVEETHEDDSSVHVMVAHKQSDNKVVPVKVEEMVQIAETQENVDHSPASCAESHSDSFKLPSQEDAIDRTNIKRHIIDVNQEISELTRDSDDDDSFLYKRDAEIEEKKEEEIQVTDDVVAAPAPVPVPAPAAPVLPNFRGAIHNIKAQIPTSGEIRDTWEGVRKELNNKINSAIDDAKKRAAALRARMIPAPHPVGPSAPAKFNPFLRSTNDETEADVGMAVPLLPVVSPFAPIQTEIAKNMAANRAASIPFQAELARNLATLRINNKLIQGNARAEVQQLFNNFNTNRWFQAPLLGAAPDAAEPEQPPQEEPKPEE